MNHFTWLVLGGKRQKAYIYKDKIGEYRWRIVSRNGKILADSGEGYKRMMGALRGLQLVTKNFDIKLEKVDW
jgi:uncharacterized protein YegP (UPF0339 family)